MRTPTQTLLDAFETHSLSGIRAVLDAGFDIHAPIDGKSPVTQLLEMYLRSDHFPACLQLMLDRGAVLDDPLIAPVLLNDADGLVAAVRASPELMTHRVTMASAFTPLFHTVTSNANRSAPVMRLLRQMQRTEHDTYDNVRALLASARRAVPPLANVPNRYLAS